MKHIIKILYTEPNKLRQWYDILDDNIGSDNRNHNDVTTWLYDNHAQLVITNFGYFELVFNTNEDLTLFVLKYW